jgi:acetylornithine deacetylase/succinyl-diaminopimelate desuccinylase-like protein
MDVRDYIAANAADFSRALREWLAIPSVSADPARHGDVRASAEWLAGYLSETGFPVVEVWETGGLPAVYAHWPIRTLSGFSSTATMTSSPPPSRTAGTTSRSRRRRRTA